MSPRLAMLIEFSVANFRSFREKQTLSMVASPRLTKRANVFAPEVVGERLPKLLKACVIYGPNASGKSNLLKALCVAMNIATRSPSARYKPLPVAPFKFDVELRAQPSDFEYHFVVDGCRYQFDLSATTERIITERLTAYPKGDEALLYERKWSGETDVYRFGSELEGEAGILLLATWKKLTPPQLLFIAQAVANSSEQLKLLRAPLDWLRYSVSAFLNGMDSLANIIRDEIQAEPMVGENLASFLSAFDVPVSKIESQDAPGPTFESVSRSEGGVREAVGAAFTNSKRRTTLTHISAIGEAKIEYEDESKGTKNLIGFWLPWVTTIDERCILVVDELDSSLHPNIIAALIENHLSTAIPSQMIFTTHDTHLMDAKILRRDQFWLTERDANGATQLRAIHDFAGRESEDIEKRYYEGRYRGLPLIRKV
jgi:energy-coupling factor transporter ATP-binding protein EcfA2